MADPSHDILQFVRRGLDAMNLGYTAMAFLEDNKLNRSSTSFADAKECLRRALIEQIDKFFAQQVAGKK